MVPTLTLPPGASLLPTVGEMAGGRLYTQQRPLDLAGVRAPHPLNRRGMKDGAEDGELPCPLKLRIKANLLLHPVITVHDHDLTRGMQGLLVHVQPPLPLALPIRQNLELLRQPLTLATRLGAQHHRSRPLSPWVHHYASLVAQLKRPRIRVVDLQSRPLSQLSNRRFQRLARAKRSTDQFTVYRRPS